MSTSRTMRLAIREVLRAALRNDPSVVLLGEVVASRGGATYVLEGLVQEFGPERVRETPVVENAIVGAGLGAALAGLTPVVEVFSADFLFTAGDEIWNDIAKWRYQHRFPGPIRLVIRAPMGSLHIGNGPEHVQCPEAYLAHAPGLTVVAPSSSSEAEALLTEALRGGDPVVYLEHRRLYDFAAPAAQVPTEPIRIGKPSQYARGEDLTVVAWGWMFQEAARAVAQVAQADGLRADLFSLHTLKPLDLGPILASAARTGRLLVVEEAPRTGGLGAEIVAQVVEAGGARAIEVRRVAMPDIPSPFNPRLETPLVPDAAAIAGAMRALVRRREPTAVRS